MSNEQLKPFLTALRSGDVGLMRSLLRANPGMLTYHLSGRTWLHRAAERDDLPMATMLVEEGIDINSTPATVTPLDSALREPAGHVARWMITNGARIEPGNGHRASSLCTAAGNSTAEVVQLLLDRGADVNYVYGDPPQNALSRATARGDKEIISLLWAQGAELPPIPPVRPGDLEDEVVDYMRRRFAFVFAQTFRPIVLSDAPVAVHLAPADDECPFHLLFTTGMSAAPMTIASGEMTWQFAELLMRLPSTWPVAPDAILEKENYWPVEWLLRAAHFPHFGFPWLGGHTATVDFDNSEGDHGSAYPFVWALLIADWDRVGPIRRSSGDEVHVYTVIPLFPEERDLVKANGVSELLRRLDLIGGTDRQSSLLRRFERFSQERRAFL
jgi:hypothetical protein